MEVRTWRGKMGKEGPMVPSSWQILISGL